MRAGAPRCPELEQADRTPAGAGEGGGVEECSPTGAQGSGLPIS